MTQDEMTTWQLLRERISWSLGTGGITAVLKIIFPLSKASFKSLFSFCLFL